MRVAVSLRPLLAGRVPINKNNDNDSNNDNNVNASTTTTTTTTTTATTAITTNSNHNNTNTNAKHNRLLRQRVRASLGGSLEHIRQDNTYNKYW